ncbi:MAG: SUMF1/EgtB/PvdO family nonheme iron enzyme [Magnetococcales bacterium]|nr:SUMF1/EgtB/PvdO family nonheme iron enzyme [Magnetococcales bacterium]MBF0630581.1 SUMF1/EgtB/PvdO family nonheme iron enzyme [Magnetococcales bacterium]
MPAIGFLLMAMMVLGGCTTPGSGTDVLSQPVANMKSWFVNEAPQTGVGESRGAKAYEDGVHYEGGFKDGKRHGRGIQTWPDGARYEGEYQNDKRHGQGVFTWPTMARYEGGFVEGKRHGHGVYTWPNGARYEGGYVDGQRDGAGTFSHPPDEMGRIRQERQTWGMDQLIASSPVERGPEVPLPKVVAQSVLPQTKPTQMVMPIREGRSDHESMMAAPIPPMAADSGRMQPRLWSDPETGITMAQIPGGCFSMGSETGEENEKPVHEVCVDPFWMGIHEITQKQWRLVMNWLPEQSVRGDDLPVGNVSWADVGQFFQTINRRSGIAFSLPTEAQWEFACTGGGLDKRHCGQGVVTDLAWVEENADNRVHPPGGRAPNRFGIYDMTGNLWEWVADAYDANFYRYSPRDNPDGPVAGASRVFRGGGWLSKGASARATLRYDMDPKRSYHLLGFRPVAVRVLDLR